MTILPSNPSRPRLPLALTRAEHGRWLGGVCAGLAKTRALPIAWLRAAFAVAALAGGLGILVYLACWLIIPAESEDPDATSPRGIVVLALACAGCFGLATLGALGSLATVFGFGWVVVALAATVLAGALWFWPRVGPGWALLPVAALVLPSAALAVGGVRIEPQNGSVIAAPSTLADAPVYRSGLGTMLIDLRRSTFAAGDVPLRIEAGVRRTIVALPNDRCVNVDIDYHVVPFAAYVASIVTGRTDSPFSQVAVFGDQHFARSGMARNDTHRRDGPTLKIRFESAGGSLYVRDYPDGINPGVEPDWPGYPVSPEPRPDVTGTPKAAARQLIANWRARHREQVRSKRRIDALRPGPCARKAKTRR
ncbi:MAG TPA: PspC domain-containing protein [Solirubrobacteraceae bacterium]|nr:PspC domain-containing protein [Solirubrobacteraceae bacterium]